MEGICKDIRTGAFVRVIKQLTTDTYLVMRLDTKRRYIVDKKDLLKFTCFK